MCEPPGQFAFVFHLEVPAEKAKETASRSCGFGSQGTVPAGKLSFRKVYISTVLAGPKIFSALESFQGLALSQPLQYQSMKRKREKSELKLLKIIWPKKARPREQDEFD